jgi:HAD superfamily phosphatase (TIGR01668 family)
MKSFIKKATGVFYLIFNTLVGHGADATPRAIELFERLKKIGFKTCLISNNSDERVRRFNQNIGTNYIHKAGKPATKNYVRATKIMGTRIDNTVFVGDQLFTDVFGANRIGMMTYLVKPIHPKEEIQIVLKRKLERIVLHYYRKDLAKGKIKQD